jgi:peptidylprolyl isomerase
VQDNYVTQWGNDAGARAPPAGVRNLSPEFERALAPDLPFTRLADGDVYAPLVGHTRGFPVARDPRAGRTWLAHCYGMVGVGRDMAADSGSGEELYVVIGHAPRHLDRNVSLVGRVLSGMELLSELPRGTDTMGVYAAGQARPRIVAMRVAADLPAAERVPIEMIDTAGPDFLRLVEARRNRHDEFFKVPAGRIDLCNAPLPVRVRPPAAR